VFKKTVCYILTIIALSTSLNSDNTPFQKRFVYFDRPLYPSENVDLAKEVIMRAKRLDFNGFVLSQSYLYTFLPHKNSNVDKIRQNIKTIEEFAHQNGLKFIVMHFAENMVNEIVHDSDSNNKFYQNGKFDFS